MLIFFLYNLSQSLKEGVQTALCARANSFDPAEPIAPSRANVGATCRRRARPVSVLVPCPLDQIKSRPETRDFFGE